MLMFRDLVTRYSPFAYAVAFRILNSEEEARDAVQDSMVKVWKKLDGFHEDNNFKTWLYRIVVNTCYDMLRQQKRRPEMKPDEALWQKLSLSTADGAGGQMENGELGRIIRSLTVKLSRRQKTVFILADLMNLGQDEIAEILGIRRSAVKASLFHARRAIETRLHKFL